MIQLEHLFRVIECKVNKKDSNLRVGMEEISTLTIEFDEVYPEMQTLYLYRGKKYVVMDININPNYATLTELTEVSI